MSKHNKIAADEHDIIYALRTAVQHHVHLNMLADQKANIIIGAFLVFIAVLNKNLISSEWPIIPTIILATSFALSASVALWTVMPKFRAHTEDNHMANPLFFGSFSVMEEDSYAKYMKEHLTISPDAREMMVRDLYQIGMALDRKYQKLRYSYMILIGGVACFFISFGYYQIIN